MSKSLGNIFPIREILKNYHPEVLRLFMLQSHYRSPIDYSENSLNEARAGLIRCYTTLQQIKEMQNGPTGKPAVSGTNRTPASQEDYSGRLAELTERFDAALDDDFNTAQGLGYVFDAVRLTNNFIAAEKNTDNADKCAVLDAVKTAFGHFGSVLGILQNDPDCFFQTSKEMESRKKGLDTAQIEGLIKDRQAARTAKNWLRADEIRQQLADLHIVLKDSGDTTTWSIE
jgi:cysteinyl-tRNA synthetase